MASPPSRSVELLSRLERLPRELQEQVFECLETRANSTWQHDRIARQTYSALTRTSKTLRTAAIPWLYRNHNNHYMKYNSETQFVKSICTHPGIVSHLRRIELAPDGVKSGLGSEELGLFVRQLSGKMNNMQILGDIMKALADGCHTAQMLVLLSAATNVRRLDIRPELRPSDHEECHCNEVFKWVAVLFAEPGLRGNLERLKHLTIRDTSRYRPQHAHHAHVLSLLRQLPGLQKFYGKEYSGMARNGAEAETSVERSSTLRLVELDDTGVGTEVLRDIIDSTKVLTTLRVFWGTDWAWNDGHTNQTFRPAEHLDAVSPPAILASLRQHESSLAGLHLHNLRDNGILFEDRPSLGSLMAFEKLTCLHVDEYLLRGSKHTSWQEVDLTTRLPPNLKELIVHTYGPVHALGDICHSLRAYKGSDVWITFGLQYIEKDDMVQFPFNWSDLGFFFRSWYGRVNRLAFSFFVDGVEGMMQKLADFLDQEAIDYLLGSQTPISVDNEGEIHIWGFTPEKLVPAWLFGEEEEGNEKAFDPMGWLEMETNVERAQS